MKPNDITILNIRCDGHCCIINGISKSETENLLQNVDLSKKMWNIVRYNFSLSYVKMGKEIKRVVIIKLKIWKLIAIKIYLF